MKNLEIIGKTEYRSYEETSITHKIMADFENKSIEILGNQFDSIELEKLSHWIDDYLQNTQEVITFNYPRICHEQPNIRTFHFFHYPDFPIFPIELKLRKMFDLGEYTLSPLGEILSKCGKFNFTVQQKDHTPKVQVNYEKGEVLISRRAILYSDEVYISFVPVLVWLAGCFQNKNNDLIVTLQIEYFNTLTSKIILNFLDFLEQLKLNSLKIIWLYHEDDEDMEEAGKEFKTLMNFGEKMLLKMI